MAASPAFMPQRGRVGDDLTGMTGSVVKDSVYKVAQRLMAPVRRTPWVRRMAALRRSQAILRSPPLPPLTAPGRSIVAALRRDGVWVGTAGSPQVQAILPAIDFADLASALSAAAAKHPGRPTTALWAGDTHHADAYVSGLRSRISIIAAHYFGIPALYLGAEIKREHANDYRGHTRQWHRDIEDDQVIKAIIYATDVGEGYGPFEYLPDEQSGTVSRALHGSPDFSSDETIDGIVPLEHARRCTGTAGTLVIFDGARLYHRAQPPRLADRDSVTFTFVSSQPWHIHRFQRPTPMLRRLVDDTAAEHRTLLPRRLQIGWPF